MSSALSVLFYLHKIAQTGPFEELLRNTPGKSIPAIPFVEMLMSIFRDPFSAWPSHLAVDTLPQVVGAGPHVYGT